MVSADPTQVHQIAMNLITNAYHAVEENGGDDTCWAERDRLQKTIFRLQ